MKQLALMFLLLFASLAFSQQTLVTGQIQSTNGSFYVNCKGTVVFVGQNTTPGAGPYLVGGTSVFQTSQNFGCDSTGNFALALWDNVNAITPTPSQWQFNVCSAAGYVAGPYCFSTLITITGASQNISTTLNALAPNLPFIGLPIVVNPADFTNSQFHSYFSVLLNGITPAAQFASYNLPNKLTDAIVGGVSIPVGATVTQADGGSFWAKTVCPSSGRTECNAVGLFTNTEVLGNGAAGWGANFSVNDDPAGLSTNANMTGLELDHGISGNEIGGYLRYLVLTLNPAFLGGLSGTAPTNSIGIEMSGYDDLLGHIMNLSAGVVMDDGTTAAGGRALEIGATAKSGTSLNSQNVKAARFDSGGARHLDTIFNETSTGVFSIQTPLGVSVNGTAATWTSGAGAAAGNCTVGSIYTNTTAASASTVLYVCQPANTWTAVTVP